VGLALGRAHDWFLQVSTEFCIEYERMETCVIQRDWELQYVQYVTHAFL
jgi:hypothetical protein